MRAIVGEVGACPGEAVRAGTQPVSPEVRAPRQPGRRARHGAEVEVARAPNLRVDHPLHGEAAFVGIGLGIERRRCVAGVDAARQIRQDKVGKTRLQHPQNRRRLVAEHSRFLGPARRGTGIGELDPRDGHLTVADAGGSQPVGQRRPARAAGLGPVRRGHAALRAVNDDEPGIPRGVGLGLLPEHRELLGRVRHADRHHGVPAARRRVAGRVERPDPPGKFEAGGVVGRRPRVAAGVETARLAVVSPAEQVGEGRQARARARASGRPRRGRRRRDRGRGRGRWGVALTSGAETGKQGGEGEGGRRRTCVHGSRHRIRPPAAPNVTRGVRNRLP